MKRILVIGLLVVYSHVSSAQSGQEMVSPNIDTTAVVAKSISVEERLNKQELEIQALRKDSQVLKKQMKQLRTSVFNTSRKISVSRTGSKQVIAE